MASKTIFWRDFIGSSPAVKVRSDKAAQLLPENETSFQGDTEPDPNTEPRKSGLRVEYFLLLAVIS